MSHAICPLCAHVNPDGARFCNECGSALTLVACPACEAINALAATHCHQCGAALETVERETHVAGSQTSDAMSVPTAASSETPLRDAATDRTPIALAERFERAPASARSAPPRRPLPHKRDFTAVPTEPAPFPRETSFDEPRIGSEREHEQGVERPRRAGARRAGLPVAVVAIVLVALAAGSYYGWLRTTQSNVTPPRVDANAAPADAAKPRAPVAPVPPATSSEAASTAAAAPSEPPAPPSSRSTPSAIPGGASRETTTANERATSPSRAAPATPSGEARATRARSSTTAAPKVDKDALATERLIERDLGRFLPRDATNPGAR